MKLSLNYIILLTISCFVCFYSCVPAVDAVYSKPFGEVNYDAYQTFNFLDVSVKNDSLADVNTEEIQLLKKAITREMEALGYSLSPDPDLWVNIGIMVEQKVQTRRTDFRDAPVYIGQRRYRWESEEQVVRRYEQGTVTIDLVDASRRERIWEGVATGMLTKNLKRMEKQINEAMRQLFERHPKVVK